MLYFIINLVLLLARLENSVEGKSFVLVLEQSFQLDLVATHNLDLSRRQVPFLLRLLHRPDSAQDSDIAFNFLQSILKQSPTSLLAVEQFKKLFILRFQRLKFIYLARHVKQLLEFGLKPR